MKGREDEKVRQGMEVIEKTRWEGDKTVGVEIVKRRMKREMDEMKRV